MKSTIYILGAFFFSFSTGSQGAKIIFFFQGTAASLAGNLPLLLFFLNVEGEGGYYYFIGLSDWLSNSCLGVHIWLQRTENDRVCFGKSGIHGWGLFARTNIQEGDMVNWIYCSLLRFFLLAPLLSFYDLLFSACYFLWRLINHFCGPIPKWTLWNICRWRGFLSPSCFLLASLYHPFLKCGLMKCKTPEPEILVINWCQQILETHILTAEVWTFQMRYTPFIFCCNIENYTEWFLHVEPQPLLWAVITFFLPFSYARILLNEIFIFKLNLSKNVCGWLISLLYTPFFLLGANENAFVCRSLSIVENK